MNLTINGKVQTLESPSISVFELIALKKVESPDMVSVQINGEFLDRDRYGDVILKEGDAIDFVYFMGGGAR